MSDSLVVFNQDYPLVVLVLALVLCLGLILREWFRENRRRLAFRVLGEIFLGVSLLGIIFNPAVKRSLDKSNLIILTDGFDTDQRDSLRRRVPRSRLVTLDSTGNYPILDQYGNVFVLGSGIPQYDLHKFRARSVNFLPANTLTGITQLHIPNRPEQDRNLVVKGEYRTNLPSEKLYLSGPEGVLDSVSVGQANAQFELSFAPKTVGNFIYTLSNEEGSLNERIPLVIQPGKKLKVLMVNSFPTFEVRYLKSHLARKGHEVVVRNQVSQDRYRTEFYNTNERQIQRLTSDELEKHDLLMMDWNSLTNLSRSERNAVDRAIQEEGLGLFIQPEDAVFNSTRWINLERLPVNEEAVTLNLLGDPKVVATYGFDLTTNDLQFALLNTEDEIVALGQRKGIGKVGTAILKDTYRLNLAGDSLVYSILWSGMLNGLAKENVGASSLLAQEDVVYPFEPYEFEVQNPISTELTIDGFRIPLQQNPDIPERWGGTYWARGAGWKNMVIATDTIPFYVHQPGQWRARRAYNRINANRQYFSSQTVDNRTDLYQYKEIPVLWFYLIFLLSAGFLWLEPKL